MSNIKGKLHYFNKGQRKDFFTRQPDKLTTIGHRWTNHEEHGPALRLFEEFGGLGTIHDDIKPGIVKWMTPCYIGEPGGYGADGEPPPRPRPRPLTFPSLPSSHAEAPPGRT
ncbi:hypothetical protein OH782_00110 [Streptomyces sp. NBC_01544]|uniref:hypothetical protein n=1 Tax=Streptomyces sp. NBC_01544 TaxID=2975871 RepID=UPI003866B314